MALTVYDRDGSVKAPDALFAPNAVCFKANATGNSTSPPANTWTKIAFPTKEFDPYSWYDPGTHRFTPKVPGYYFFKSALLMGLVSVADLTNIYVGVYKNGSLVNRDGFDKSGSNNNSIVQGSAMVYLNGTTDYVEIYVYSVGVSVGVSANTESYFEGFLVGSSVGVAPEPWHVVGAAGEPGFLNGWVNYDAAGSGYNSAGFMKDPHGRVFIKGLVRAGTAATPIFQLPVGYRPPERQLFTVTSDNALGRVDVTVDGFVQQQTGTNAWVSLDGLTFTVS